MSTNAPRSAEAQPALAGTLLTGAASAATASPLPTDMGGLHEWHLQRRREIAAERDALQPVLDAERHDAELGITEAADRAAEIELRMQTLDAELRATDEILADITPRLDADRRRIEALSEAQRRRAIVDGSDRFREACARLDAVGAAFYAAQAQAVAAQQHLRAALRTPAKVFEIGTLFTWSLYALYQQLVIAQPAAGNVPDSAGKLHRDVSSPAVLHLIDARLINPASPLTRKTLGQLAEETLSDVVPLFGTRAAAERARDRRDPNRRGTHHVRQAPDGLFEVVEGELRGAAARTVAKAEGAP